MKKAKIKVNKNQINEEEKKKIEEKNYLENGKNEPKEKIEKDNKNEHNLKKIRKAEDKIDEKKNENNDKKGNVNIEEEIIPNKVNNQKTEVKKEKVKKNEEKANPEKQKDGKKEKDEENNDKELNNKNLEINNKENKENLDRNFKEKTNENSTPLSLTSSSIVANNEHERYTNFFQSKIYSLLIEREEDSIEGKEYEIRVKKIFKIFLDYCSSQDLKVESNTSTNYSFLYKLVPNYKKTSRNKDNVVEFDVLIKDVNISTISNLIKKFPTSIIKHGNLEQLQPHLNYDIIGEVAKDLLNQSIEKKKQISKYIDIILIDKEIKNIQNEPEHLKENYQSLNLSIKTGKMLILFTNGSFIKLKDAFNIMEKLEDKNLLENEQIYNSRDIKNIKNLKIIISELDNAKIPYIIFYIGNDLSNDLDNILLNYIKQNDINNKDLKKKITENENKMKENLLQSVFINSITEKIKSSNYEIFNLILNSLDASFLFYKFSSNIENIFKNLIKINLFKDLNITIIILTQDKENVRKSKIFQDLENQQFEYGFIKIDFIEKEEDLVYLIQQKNFKNNNYQMNFLILNKIKLENELLLLNYFNQILDLNQLNVLTIKYETMIKYLNLIKEKIYSYVSKNFNYYSNDKEYLCFNNFNKKIVYDLENMNSIFKVNKEYDDTITIENKIIYSTQNYFMLLNSSMLNTELEKKINNEKKIKFLKLEQKITINKDIFDKLYELYYYFFMKILPDKLYSYLEVIPTV